MKTIGEVIRAIDTGVKIRGLLDDKLPIRSITTDSRAVKYGDLFVALRGERFCGNAFVKEAFSRGAAAALVLADAPFEAPDDRPVLAVADTAACLGAIGAEHRRELYAQVIGITGSVGKTTTREFLRHLLEGVGSTVAAEHSFNNAIGVPLTLLRADEDTQFLIVEIGTSKEGEVRSLAKMALPDIGIVTRVAPAHLEGLKDLDGVAREKSGLVRALKARTGIACLNADDLRVRAMATLNPAAVVTYGFSEDATIRGEIESEEADSVVVAIRVRGGEPVKVRMPFRGHHFVSNALGALAAAYALGLPVRDLALRFESVKLPERRSEAFALGPYRIVDDAYNANPASTLAAVELLAKEKGRKVLVLGGMRELGNQSEALHRDMGRAAFENGIDAIVTVGQLAAAACDEARKCGMRADCAMKAESHDAAAAALGNLLTPGDTVLFKGSRGERLEVVIEALRARVNVDRGSGSTAHGGGNPASVGV